MATTFVNLPTVAGNGAGAAVDTSGLAAGKTIVNGGNGYVFEPFVSIQIANDAGAANWQTVHTFQGRQDEVTLVVAARWMRAVVSNYRGGTAPQVDLGSDLDPTVSFATLVGPAADGNGAAVATDTLPMFKTVQIAGTFKGSVNVQVTEDAGTTWRTVMSFTAPGVQSAAFTSEQMRIQRTGVPTLDPGLPSAYIAAVAGASGGTDGVSVQNSGTPIANNPHNILNFTGGGVAATDAGGGVATITISASFAPPEKWAQNTTIAVSQTNVALSCLVSTVFDDIKMIRAGSIVGIGWRLRSACTNGTLTVKPTKNGLAVTLSGQTTNASNQSGGQVTQASGVDTYVAGDLIGVQVTTDGSWAPTSNDIEAWLEVIS